MLRIDRKRHRRKRHTRKGRVVKPTTVKRAVYLTRDRGKRGRVRERQ